MGVDFFPCDSCGETVCDAGPWWQCQECSNRLCEDCERKYNASNDWLEYDEDEMEEEGIEVGCPFCRKQKCKDEDLLDFALGKLGLTKDQLEAEYKAS